MKLPKFLMAATVAAGLFTGGCTEFYGTVGTGGYYGDTLYPDDGYYALDSYDGPDYVYLDRGRYYYDWHHRDDHWRHEHERNFIRGDRDLRERISRSRVDRAGHAGHEIRGTRGGHDGHDDHDHH